MKRFGKFLLAGALIALGNSQSARAATVDLALVLATDVSGSVDGTDFTLMQTGYVNAFQSASLIEAIQSGAIGSIAVTLVYWSDAAAVAVPWTTVSDAASAKAFADAVAVAPRPFAGGTGMVNAINFSSGLFASAPEATRQVIDIAGDGSEGNACGFADAVCAPLQGARDSFLGLGANRTINALWIQDRDFFGTNPGDVINSLDYGSTNVIGGPNAFQEAVAGFADFELAIKNKLEREVRPPGDVPEPSTYAMVIGALGVLFLRRRR